MPLIIGTKNTYQSANNSKFRQNYKFLEYLFKFIRSNSKKFMEKKSTIRFHTKLS